MEQLVKIQTNADGIKAVSAFELYKELGFNITNNVHHDAVNNVVTENKNLITN